MADTQTVDPVAQKVDELLPMIRQAENSGDTAVSPKGAIGRYQIMPGTAQSLGFDPTKLKDPSYNEQAARAVIGDLIRQHGPDDTKAILAGYNTSPAAVQRWKGAGRDDKVLPLETQHYFARAGVLSDAHTATPNKFGHAPDTTSLAKGAADYQSALDSGFTQQEADEWRTKQVMDQRAAGFTEDEIGKYWGTNPPPDDHVRRMVQGNLANTPPEKQQEIVDNPLKAVEYGWRTSVAGLSLRGDKPNMVLPENAGLFNKVASGLTQSALDIPYTVLGMVEGAPLGAAAGEAVGGPGGALIGGVAGAGAGGYALPNTVRNTLLESYEYRDGHKTGKDFFGSAGNILVQSMKDMATGAVSMVVGGKMGATALKAGAPKAVATGVNVLGTATSATAVGAALDGHTPTAEDFITGAATVAGFAAAGHVMSTRLTPNGVSNTIAQNLRDIYRKTGIGPAQAASMARGDPAVLGEILSRNAFGEQMTPRLDEHYKTSPGKIADEHEQMMQSLFTEAAQKAADKVKPQEPMDVRTDEERAAKEAARQEYLKKKSQANIVQFEDARLKQTLGRLGEHDYDMPPPSGPEAEVIPPEDNQTRPKVTDETIKLNDDMLADKLMDGKVATQDRTSIWNNAKTIYRQFVTELFPARVLDDQFKPDSKSLGIEDMLRQTYASRERAGYFMRYGTLDPLTFADTGGPSYLKGYEAVKEDGGNYKTFEAYRVAKRTVDLAERGINSGFDLDVAKKLVEQGKDKYERGNSILNENKNASIDYARDSGVFSEAMAEGIKTANPSHIMLRRVTEPGYNPPRGRGFGAKRPVKKIEGSDLHIVDPTTADIENLHTIIAMADRNRAVGSVVGAIEQHEADLPADQHTFQRAEPLQLGKHSEILDTNGNRVPDADAASLEPLIAHRAFSARMDANSFLYFRNGVAEVWRTKDPELANLLRTSQPGPEMHFLLKAAEKFARVSRLGITGAPDFPLRSAVRAQFEASILGKNGGVPMADFFHGIMDVVGQSEKYKEWVANGGLGSALTSMDTDYIKRDLNGVFEATGTVNHVWNTIRHPLDALRTFRELVDSASRLGYAKRAEAQGLTAAKAAVEGRKAYIDNSERAGLAVVNNWARITPFLRTSVLDVDQFVRAVKENPLGTALKGAAWVSLPTIANYLANYYSDQAHKDEPGFTPYSELPRWQKDMFYVLPPINGVRLRLPLKPYVSSFFFGTLVERFLDHSLRSDPRAFKEWGDSFVAQFVPPVIPALALPVMEHYTNTRTLSHKALIPANLEGASGYMQYTPDTSETAKGLSRILSPEVGLLSHMNRGVDVSPIVLENYAREWAGTLPFTALKVLESPWHQQAHPWTVSDIPFVQSFVARNPGMAATSVQDFYDASKTVEESHKDLALAVKNLNTSEIKESSAKVQAFVSMQDMKTALANQANVIEAINKSDKMTNDEKLTHIDALYSAMIKTAQGGLKLTDAINGK